MTGKIIADMIADLTRALEDPIGTPTSILITVPHSAALALQEAGGEWIGGVRHVEGGEPEVVTWCSLSVRVGECVIDISTEHQRRPATEAEARHLRDRPITGGARSAW